ncbi:hypothetical protein BDQ17DRAFT_1331214 [Cyathus striatus]|nr:hypothetical protein BDQ17DRAFT_1331214 [Cyathus striatus]
MFNFFQMLQKRTHLWAKLAIPLRTKCKRKQADNFHSRKKAQYGEDESDKENVPNVSTAQVLPPAARTTDPDTLRDRTTYIEQEPSPPPEWGFVPQFFVNWGTYQEPSDSCNTTPERENMPEIEGSFMELDVNIAEVGYGDNLTEVGPAEDNNEARDSESEGDSNPNNDVEGESNIADDYVKKHWIPPTVEAAQEGHKLLHQILHP